MISVKIFRVCILSVASSGGVNTYSSLCGLATLSKTRKRYLIYVIYR